MQLNTAVEKFGVESTAPFLIATGPNRLAISQFYIVIDGKIIPLPVNFNFVKSFDILFKTFYVLNIEFSNSLKNLFNFLALYIYKISKEKPSIRLREINLKFENKLTKSIPVDKTISGCEKDN